MPGMVMSNIVKPKPVPAAIEQTVNQQPGAQSQPPIPVLPSDGTRPFALPPEPPHIPGASSGPYTGPPAPTLDMRQLPRL